MVNRLSFLSNAASVILWNNFISSVNIMWSTTRIHLNNSIKNSEFLPPGFLAKRKDRENGYGGVIIIYRDTIKANEITHYSS